MQTSYPHVSAQAPLEITVATNKAEYYRKEPVVISGNLRYGLTPVSDVLVALQMKDSRNSTFAYRALPTGGTPTLEGVIEIHELTPIDFTTQLPKLYFKAGSLTTFRLTLRNNGPATGALVTLTIFDGNMISVGGYSDKTTLQNGVTNYTAIQIPIENWAYTGPAKIVATVFSDYPSIGGVPLCLETAVSFGIVRGDITTSYVPPPTPEPPTQPGTFNTTIRLRPEPFPGNYTVFVSARKYGLTAINNRAFQVKSTSSEAPSPPQASFTYLLRKAYVNVTVGFDASASTPDNYNDNITGYEWDWGDGSLKSSTTSPTISHKYTAIGTYNVTLKITDNDSWCLATKPVTIHSPDPPTANFTWSPDPPIFNQSVTFNASISKPGWNGTQNIPIVSYRWDFGDGNITTVTVPVINHKYSQNATYNVTLTVTDSKGLQDSQTYIVEVLFGLLGDINRDGSVDGKDIAIAAKAFGTEPGDPLWNREADVNNDGAVDGKDISIIAKHFGESLYGFAQSYTSASKVAFKATSVPSNISPPQASFTFPPVKKYVNTSVGFDASTSSPENFGDNITGYEWDWGDGSPRNVTTSPLSSHKFTTTGTYNVTLKATNNYIWAVTLKPITIGPPDPPVANFTWSPDKPAVNHRALFDASISKPGWNGTQNIPIVSYRWDFGDGNITTVSDPVISHTYAQNGTYTVTLNVTDNGGLQDNQTYIIEVTTGLVGDVDGDGSVDGKDIAIAARAFGTSPGDPRWDPRADVNNDGTVDGKDISIIAKYFGQSL